MLFDLEKVVAQDLGDRVLRHATTDPTFVHAISKLNVFEFGLLMQLVVLVSRNAASAEGEYTPPGLDQAVPPDFFDNPTAALKWFADYIRRQPTERLISPIVSDGGVLN